MRTSGREEGSAHKGAGGMTTATAVLILAVFVVLDLLKYWISEVSEPRERERDTSLMSLS